MASDSCHTLETAKRRIDSLIKERPGHREVLEFLQALMIEQYKIRPKLKAVPFQMDQEKIREMREGFPLLEKRDLDLDIPSAVNLFRRLCKVLYRSGKAPEHARRIIRALRSREIDPRELLRRLFAEDGEYLSSICRKLALGEDLLLFLAASSLKPFLEAYARDLKDHVNQEEWWRGYCPICGSLPFIAEIQEEGERFLVCSLCGFEWRFPRVKCPFCENEDHKRLRYFYTEGGGTATRVEVCERCRRYIKAVNTGKLGGETVPLVEDMGTLYLDLVAQKEGYTRGGVAYGGSLLPFPNHDLAPNASPNPSLSNNRHSSCE